MCGWCVCVVSVCAWCVWLVSADRARGVRVCGVVWCVIEIKITKKKTEDDKKTDMFCQSLEHVLKFKIFHFNV